MNNRSLRIALFLLLTLPVSGQADTFQTSSVRHYDKYGRYIGKSVRADNVIREYDNYGRFTGKKIITPNETRSYDKYGKLIMRSKK